MSSSWLPTRAAALMAALSTFAGLITANPATYGLTAPDALAIQTEVDQAQAAYDLATNPTTRTPPAIADKDVQLNEAAAIVRTYARIIRANTAVADGDKTALGLTLPDTTPTVIPPPTTFPLVSILSATPGEVQAKYNDSSTPTSRAKPSGTLMMELYAVTSATAISDPNTLPYLAPITKTPFSIPFAPADAGKTAYIAARWVNRKGQRGPWSAVTHTVVV